MAAALPYARMAVRKKASDRVGWWPGPGREPAFEDFVDRSSRFERKAVRSYLARSRKR
jgi:hypothetical protein